MTDSAGGDGFPHFIDAVSRRSGLPTEQAAALARAVLQTMAERVTGGPPDLTGHPPDDLTGHLPDEVDGYLNGAAPSPPANPSSPPAGVAGWPADPAGLPADPAGLPADPAGLPGGLAGLPAELAGSSSDPVPDPVTGVDGLDTGVGLDVGGPVTTPPPVDAGPAEFLRRVGQRAGVDPATARAGTGAVFATLREAVTVREFREMVARLPRDDDGGAATGPPVLPDPSTP
ncbi:DUF2267 domain-containing protein [Micromonospora lupini]|uniref:DUF2267 domain-containing protein n=1 Tax=Micromonospora lupini str. Lupac 08 TaxID=1150864 RepID=I0L2Q3_9ACTN|nr:DUF2267 domain-containing protein [Micromonospora lupini]CCH18100.1 conserved hypothetical protein [Micromonospora lupini str. Lupac 08]